MHYDPDLDVKIREAAQKLRELQDMKQRSEENERIRKWEEFANVSEDVLPLIEHGRTSCDQTENHYMTKERPYPRCNKCGIMYVLSHGRGLYGVYDLDITVSVRMKE